jgi:hypothetical protein
MWYALPVVMVIGFISLMMWSNARRHRTVAERSHITLASFINEFLDSGYSQRAIETAYIDLSGLCQHPVLRRDSLEKTLGLLPEDFDCMLETRCKELGVVDVWKSPYAKLFPLKIVEDYVRFLSEVMKDHPAAA